MQAIKAQGIKVYVTSFAASPSKLTLDWTKQNPPEHMFILRRLIPDGILNALRTEFSKGSGGGRVKCLNEVSS